jgi:hypothetical protein
MIPRVLGAALALALIASPAAAAAGGLPYRIVIAPEWGAGAGSDVFRDDVGRAVADALSHACFAEVALADGATRPEGDLLLALYLSNAIEELRFDDPIAGALMPGEPGKELRREAYFEVSIDAELRSLADLALIERKAINARIARRPMILGEDPQATARQEAIDRIVRDLAKAFCRGGDKLAKKIKAALEPSASSPR